MINTRKWKIKHKIVLVICITIIIGLLIFGFPLLISFLFFDNWGIPVKWNAKDYLALYGSLLAFSGTAFLGYIAVRQNKTVIDVAQKANELNTINKIISVEAERMGKIENIINDYSYLTGIDIIVGIATNMKTDDTKKHFNNASNELYRLSSEISKNFLSINSKLVLYDGVIDVDDFNKAIMELDQNVNNVINDLRDKLIANDVYNKPIIDDKQIGRYQNLHMTFAFEKDKLYFKLNKLLDKLMYEDLALEDITELFRDRKSYDFTYK